MEIVWTLDPQRGFLATETLFSPGGRLAIHRVLRVEEIAPGLWYPVACEETLYQEGVDPPMVRNWVKSEIKDIKIDEPIPDEQFEIEAMGLLKDQPDVTVLRTTVEGRTMPCVYRDGRLVPRP